MRGRMPAWRTPAFRELPWEAGAGDTVPGQAVTEAAVKKYELPDTGVRESLPEGAKIRRQELESAGGGMSLHQGPKHP